MFTLMIIDARKWTDNVSHNIKMPTMLSTLLLENSWQNNLMVSLFQLVILIKQTSCSCKALPHHHQNQITFHERVQQVPFPPIHQTNSQLELFLALPP